MQNLQNIVTTKNIIIYFIIINIIGFLIMFIDKQKAKKGKWRIPEKTLFIITALGGGIGTIAGMLAVLFYIVLYNQMMIYVENNAYKKIEK